MGPFIEANSSLVVTRKTLGSASAKVPYTCSWETMTFTFSATSIPGYQNLTSSNFIANHSSGYNTSDQKRMLTSAPTISYNASSGVVTVYGSAATWCNESTYSVTCYAFYNG